MLLEFLVEGILRLFIKFIDLESWRGGGGGFKVLLRIFGGVVWLGSPNPETLFQTERYN